MLSALDYAMIADIVFNDDYPGYKPKVVEAPNGDGQYDEGKIYAHINQKYLDEWLQERAPEKHEKAKRLAQCLVKLHDEALEVAVREGIPREFFPDIAECTLRIIDYPPEVGSDPHKDFNLFTINCYRNIPSTLLSDGALEGTHYGELMEELGLRKATTHQVLPLKKTLQRQYSIVYFAIPNHEALLPSGISVKDWLEERLSRSRSTKA